MLEKPVAKCPGDRPAADGGGEDGSLGILWRARLGPGGEPKVVITADEVVAFVILRR
jgi:hypothetical protein